MWDNQEKMWQSQPHAQVVYLMKASDGTSIYIVKAVDLPNRVRSNFQQK